MEQEGQMGWQLVESDQSHLLSTLLTNQPEMLMVLGQKYKDPQTASLCILHYTETRFFFFFQLPHSFDSHSATQKMSKQIAGRTEKRMHIQNVPFSKRPTLKTSHH
jgi:hypothetical protein